MIESASPQPQVDSPTDPALESNAPHTVANRYRFPWGRFAIGFSFLILTALICGNIWVLNSQIQRMSETSQERYFWMVCHNESSPEAKKAALMGLIAGGNTEWRSADFSQMQLEGVSLKGVSLTYANFRYASFQKADLSEADLSYGILTAVNFNDSELTGAMLVEADLLKAQLKNANLRNGNLRGISLDQAVVTNASLVLADMSESHLLMADFSDSDLTGTDLRSANLEAAILARTNLALAHLGNANLESTDFTNANWWRARGLSSTQLEELRSKFPPTSDAPDSLADDYELWLLSIENRDSQETSPRSKS